MTLLFILLIVGLLFIFFKYGINRYSVVGGIIGLILGSSLGVAGGGTAVNGIFIFGCIGFIIGGLLKPTKNNEETQIHYSNSRSNTKSETKTTITAIPKRNYENYNFDHLVDRKMYQHLAKLIFDLENMRDIDKAEAYMSKIKNADFELYEKVTLELKKIRLNHFMK